MISLLLIGCRANKLESCTPCPPDVNTGRTLEEGIEYNNRLFEETILNDKSEEEFLKEWNSH